MIDPLFARAQLAVLESRSLRQQRRAIAQEHVLARHKLRCAIFECASCRTEIMAHREEREASLGWGNSIVRPWPASEYTSPSLTLTRC
jgi:hypothetical protein